VKKKPLNAEQLERRSVQKGFGPSDNRRRGGTYRDFAEAEFSGDRGRFTAQSKSAVTGADPVPTYPVLPASSPFHHDPVGHEPPLGFDVNALEPTGTHVEVEQSLQALGEAGSPSSGQPDGGAGSSSTRARTSKSGEQLPASSYFEEDLNEPNRQALYRAYPAV
jgi:hypothetical protein